MIIDVFKNKLFPVASGNYYEEFKEESSESEDGEKPGDENEESIKQINELNRIYVPLIKRYFMEKSLIEIIKKLKDYKEKPEKLQMHNNLLNCLNIGLEKLGDDI